MASDKQSIDDSCEFSDEELANFARERSHSLRRGIAPELDEFERQEGHYSEIIPGGYRQRKASPDDLNHMT